MQRLEDQTPGAGVEIQLTDAMERLLETGEMYAVVVDSTDGCDTGVPVAWAAASARIALSNTETHDEFCESLGLNKHIIKSM